MLELIPHTPRRKMSTARAAKIKLARNGICFNCGQQIRDGQPWFIEHPDSLAQGGSDKDEDLWPSHVACKAGKDAVDAAAKAKRDRLVTTSYVPDGQRQPSRLQGKGFRKAPPQHTATRQFAKRVTNGEVR